jgi:hypothetical protein
MGWPCGRDLRPGYGFTLSALRCGGSSGRLVAPRGWCITSLLCALVRSTRRERKGDLMTPDQGSLKTSGRAGSKTSPARTATKDRGHAIAEREADEVDTVTGSRGCAPRHADIERESTGRTEATTANRRLRRCRRPQRDQRLRGASRRRPDARTERRRDADAHSLLRAGDLSQRRAATSSFEVHALDTGAAGS